MNKIAIPALLLGVVMIAGAFAFMPVQEASTVHTSAATTGTQMKMVTIIGTCTDADQDANCDVDVDIPDGVPFTVVAAKITVDADYTSTEEINGAQITVHGDNTGITVGVTVIAQPAQDAQVSGGYSGIGTGTDDILGPTAYTVNGGVDGGSESFTYEITLILPGDTTNPSVNFS